MKLDYLIPQGFLKRITSPIKGVGSSFRKLFSEFLNDLNVPFYDECCSESSDSPSPVRADGDSELEYFNSSTKTWEPMSISGGGGDNIYNSNGTLTANRSLTLDSKTFEIIGFNDYTKLNLQSDSENDVIFIGSKLDIHNTEAFIFQNSSEFSSEITYTTGYDNQNSYSSILQHSQVDQSYVNIEALDPDGDTIMSLKGYGVGFVNTVSDNIRVGIGAVNPSYPLDIHNNAGVASGWGNVQMRIYSEGTEAGLVLANDNGSNWSLISAGSGSGVTTGSFSIGSGGANIFQLNGVGSAQLPQYGSGTFTDSPAYILAITATGDIIEVDPNTAGIYTATSGLHDAGGGNFRLGGTMLENINITNSSGFHTSFGSSSITDYYTGVVNIQGNSCNTGLFIDLNANIIGGASVDYDMITLQGYWLGSPHVGEGIRNLVSQSIAYISLTTDDGDYAGGTVNGLGLHTSYFHTLKSKVTNANFATRTAEFTINAAHNGVFREAFKISGTGQIVFPTYATDVYTGTAAFNLAIDASGNIITVAASGGGSTTNAVTFNNAGSGAASGTTFDGSTARTISYNTIGAQPTLVSATNIKTINSATLLGSGDLAVQATLVSGTNIKTINGSSILGAGDLTVSGANIYNADGTLTGNRVVSTGGNSFSLTDGAGYSFGFSSSSIDFNTFEGSSIGINAGLSLFGSTGIFLGTTGFEVSIDMNPTDNKIDINANDKIALNAPRTMMPNLQASTSYVNDAAAAIGGVQVGELYHNAGAVRIRLV